jgi:hypothetical protein
MARQDPSPRIGVLSERRVRPSSICVRKLENRFTPEHFFFESAPSELKRLARRLRSEARDVGSEARDVGSEARDVGSEGRDVGSEGRDVGSEAQALGPFAMVSPLGRTSPSSRRGLVASSLKELDQNTRQGASIFMVVLRVVKEREGHRLRASGYPESCGFR